MCVVMSCDPAGEDFPCTGRLLLFEVKPVAQPEGQPADTDAQESWAAQMIYVRCTKEEPLCSHLCYPPFRQPRRAKSPSCWLHFGCSSCKARLLSLRTADCRQSYTQGVPGPGHGGVVLRGCGAAGRGPPPGAPRAAGAQLPAPSHALLLGRCPSCL